MKTRKIFLLFFATMLMLVVKTSGQIQTPVLMGYVNNWNAGTNPYVQLTDVPKQYGMIAMAFSIPRPGTDYDTTFVSDGVAKDTLIRQIKTVQNQGRRVLISVGGATAPISLDNLMERDTFISSITRIINTYGFDGIDIDFEGNSILVSKGTTIANPTDVKIINLIAAIKQIMVNFRATHGRKMILTMAPEMSHFPGGISGYGNNWGAYLPIIDALRDSLDLVHTQLYNGGSMNGLDGRTYYQATGDFIVAMTELCIRGFNTTGGYFKGLPANKIAVGLPACPSAAGSGFMDTATVAAAMRYLLGKGPKVGTYTLLQAGGYPTLGGMMTWSINWDKVTTCNNSEYEFMKNYERIFSNTTPTTIAEVPSYSFKIYPNPSNGVFTIESDKQVSIEIYDLNGKVLKAISNQTSTKIDVSDFSKGMYFLRMNDGISIQTEKIIIR